MERAHAQRLAILDEVKSGLMSQFDNAIEANVVSTHVFSLALRFDKFDPERACDSLDKLIEAAVAAKRILSPRN